MVWELGLDVQGGIVRIGADLRAAWPVTDRLAWATALANLGRRPIPRVVAVTDGPAGLAVVTDGPWTTGSLLRPTRLASGRPLDRAVVVSPELVVVAEPGVSIDRALPAVRPLVVLRKSARLPSPDLWILE